MNANKVKTLLVNSCEEDSVSSKYYPLGSTAGGQSWEPKQEHFQKAVRKEATWGT